MKQFSQILFGLLMLTQSAQAQVAVQVNCSQWEEYPLVKKIGVYQTPLVNKNWLDRDFPKLEDLEARSMRYEMACGKDDLYGQPCVLGTAKRPTYSMTDVDYLLTLAKKYTPSLIIAHGYTPTILQSRPDEWAGFMDTPTDYNTWSAINKRFAREWRSKKYTNSYVEIWNEPDLKDGFFTGTLEDYLHIYETAAPAVIEGYSDIKVGGPSGAFNWWHQALCDRAKQKGLPLDFLSGHTYGPDYSGQLNAMRAALNSLGNNEAEMLLTEYSPYTPAEYQADGPVEKAEAAMTFFNALPGMLACPDLTHVSWAQYIDPGFFVGDKLGLIDRDSGAPKALYNAFRLYGMMPADRCQINIGGNVLQGMASVADDCVTAVVWNPSTTEQTFNMTLTNIPFKTGTLEVWHIDETENSWYETRKSTFTVSRSEPATINLKRQQLSDFVRSKGVCFVRIKSDEAKPLFPTTRLGTVVRTHQWFPNRTNEASYALFDPKTWTVRMSSNQEATGWALVGIEAERLPDYIQVNGKRNGSMRRNGSNYALCLRIDYQASTGEYVHSVLFHGGVYRDTRTTVLPWGTKRVPDEVVRVDNLNDFVIPVAEHQPADFNGRVILTCDMASIGSGVKQNFQFSEGTPTGISTPTPTAGEVQEEAFYDLTGRRMHHAEGLCIVRHTDGSTQKIYVPR
ncbi:MAG: hypothetical protein II801_03915 [Bacteroidaceae bacterium]|nr:hypothetical protein [Bacteroidaceae bacterium]